MEHSTNMCSHKRETVTEKLTMCSLTLAMTVSSETNLSCENIWSPRELHLGAVVNFLPNTSGCGCRRLLCEHFRRHPLRFRCRRLLSEHFRRHPLRFRCRRLLNEDFRRHPLRCHDFLRNISDVLHCALNAARNTSRKFEKEIVVVTKENKGCGIV